MSARKTTSRKGPDRRAEITAKLADGIDALVTTEAWQAYLDVQARFHSYSFGNTMLIRLQCPHATRVTGYGKKDGSTGWLSLGRQVRSGERAIWIWAPSFRRETDPETGEDDRRVFFVPVPVFDISQTEGADLPEPVAPLTGEAPEGMLDAAVAFIENQGFDVEFVPAIPDSGAEGDTDYSRRRVRICTSGHTTMDQFSTALHEAAHVLLHEGSQLPGGLKELEAESVAYVAAAALGADTSGYSFGYVLGWMGDDPEAARKAIRASASRIQKAAGRIIDEIPVPARAEAAA